MDISSHLKKCYLWKDINSRIQWQPIRLLNFALKGHLFGRIGSGKNTVNGKVIEAYFARPVLRMLVQQPMTAWPRPAAASSSRSAKRTFTPQKRPEKTPVFFFSKEEKGKPGQGRPGLPSKPAIAGEGKNRLASATRNR